MKQGDLRIKPVKPTVVASLITKLPSGDYKKDMMQAGKTSMKLLEYCVGWGVIDNPPNEPVDPRTIKYEEGDAVPELENALREYNKELLEYEEVQELFELFESRTLREQRVVWVSHIVCKDITDTQALMERILALTG